LINIATLKTDRSSMKTAKFPHILKAFFLLTLGLSLLSCAPKKEEETTTPTTSEPDYCSTVQDHSGGITISGSAKYERRVFTGSGLGGVDSTTYPIRYAEIQVLDGTTVVQCGETDANGDFSLVVPSSGATYTLKVNSRANNDYVKTSVLNSPESATYYSVSTDFTADSSKSIGTLTASATDSSVTGGAFNIYDQVVASNLYLRSETSSCTSNFSSCREVTVAPKSYLYWTAGYNPGARVGVSSGLSYYEPGQDRLFILGGISGDTDNTDTDHFDNSVIVHEYGHFIEDQYSVADSPGGSHSGDAVIDPRLAWAEGFATFFALAVLGETSYRDTQGNSDGETRYFFDYNLEDNLDAVSNLSLDVPTEEGEGIFREFAISRTLLDFIDTPAESGEDDVDANFDEFWTSFAGTSGLANTSNKFRDMGLLLEIQGQLTGATDLSTLKTYNKMRADRKHYAYPVSTQASSCTNTLVPSSSYTGCTTSNQYADHDFFLYTHSGGTATIQLEVQSGDADLDLYLYNDGYRLCDSGDIAAASDEASPGDGGTEEISTSLNAGSYLINVSADVSSAAPSTTTYTLMVNGEYVCLP
jgi:hypothetical protein